mmetsp:Transcript_58534/g.148557  ORF Transcript_58534/g.148557 Transcript_58534/m.148557 type:complete len:236 (+) Transcript_58534:138-845(+)
MRTATKRPPGRCWPSSVFSTSCLGRFRQRSSSPGPRPASCSRSWGRCTSSRASRGACRCTRIGPRSRSPRSWPSCGASGRASPRPWTYPWQSSRLRTCSGAGTGSARDGCCSCWALQALRNAHTRSRLKDVCEACQALPRPGVGPRTTAPGPPTKRPRPPPSQACPRGHRWRARPSPWTAARTRGAKVRRHHRRCARPSPGIAARTRRAKAKCRRATSTSRRPWGSWGCRSPCSP